MTRESLDNLIRSLGARQAFLLQEGSVLASAGPDPAPTGWMLQLAAWVQLAGRPRLVARAARERAAMRETQPVFTSALAVPVNPTTVLYLDSVAELDLQAMDRARAVAREAGSPPRPTVTWKPRNPTAALLLAVGAVWFVAGLFLAGSARPRPAATAGSARPRPAATAGSAAARVRSAREVAASFLACLRLKSYPEAYRLLSARQQGQVSPEQFQQQFGAWLQDARNRFELLTRRLEEAPEDETGTCVVRMLSQEVDEPPWALRLVLEEPPPGPATSGREWRVEAFEGGPLRTLGD